MAVGNIIIICKIKEGFIIIIIIIFRFDFPFLLREIKRAGASLGELNKSVLYVDSWLGLR